jgi:hypothetical protein
MTAKDYVYLGLIALVALIFYCHGFYAGVSRCRRLYQTLLEENEEKVVSPDSHANNEELPSLFPPPRQRRQWFPHRDLRGDFGNN